MTAGRINAGFFREYGVTPAEISENEALLSRFRENRRITLDRVTWFIPYFDHIYRGGIHTIMRFADYFSRQAGTLNRFVFYGHGPRPPKDLDIDIGKAFPDLGREILTLGGGITAGDLPESDIGICTYWTSAYHLLRYNRCRGKFYFVQDFEPAFSPAGSIYGLTEATYTFGFEGIVNTPGVWEIYRQYQPRSTCFVPAVDGGIFYPPEKGRDNSPLRMVFYARPGKPRNGFELGLNALKMVKDHFGERIEIYTAGEDFDPADHGSRDVLTNLGVIPSLEELAGFYRTCHAGLALMFTAHPSYQPLEYMACGCAVVTNDNHYTRWLFKDGKNALLSRPTAPSLADALIRVLEDGDLRRQVTAGGLETIGRYRWEGALDDVYRFVTKGEGVAAPDTPAPPTPKIVPNAEEPATWFHRLFYDSKETTWGDTRWLGVPLSKCPFDLWIYQEIVWELKPEVIVECGTYKGGSALFLASLCDLINQGTVVTIDVRNWGQRPAHERIRYLEGSSLSREVLEEVGRLTEGKGPVMVILDSDHDRDHVLQELRAYSHFVTRGSYLILEDTNINGHPVRPDFGPGPREALEEFLAENGDFVPDRDREKFLFSFNPGGYLRRMR